jgi:hypothetical protein
MSVNGVLGEQLHEFNVSETQPFQVKNDPDRVSVHKLTAEKQNKKSVQSNARNYSSVTTVCCLK